MLMLTELQDQEQWYIQLSYILYLYPISSFKSRIIKIKLLQINNATISTEMICLKSFSEDFRAHYETETALVKVASDVLMASDNGLVSVLVQLNQCCIWYNQSQQNLEHLIAIRRIVWCWFKSHLSDRCWFVHVNEEFSLIDQLVMVFHRVLCLDQYFSLISFFLYLIMSLVW